jgi:hypothetical protein
MGASAALAAQYSAEIRLSRTPDYQPWSGSPPGATPEDSVQLITRTQHGQPPVVIDVNTLDDDGCREHLQRLGRINSGHPPGHDAEYA